MSSMTDLPSDCLHIIFNKLQNRADQNAFGLTCRRWLQIQNSACRLLQFNCFHGAASSKNNISFLSRLLVRFQQLELISLSGCTELPDSALTQLQVYGSNLQTLLLDCCFGITDSGLSLVSAGCPSLVSISLYRCNITDVGLEILAKSCSTLKNVNLSHCSLVSDHGIMSLTRDCLKLRSVTISCCRCISGTGFKGCPPTLAYLEADSCALTPDGLLGAVSGGGLVYLNISNMRCWAGGDGLASIGAGYATRLRFLNLRLCRFVGNKSVGTIAKGCPLLEEWNLSLCHEVRVSGWEAIGLNCHNLKVLHVNRCRNLCDHGLQALQDGCEQLAVMYMHGCRRVTPLGLESFRWKRLDVKIKREENVSVGPCLDMFFL